MMKRELVLLAVFLACAWAHSNLFPLLERQAHIDQNGNRIIKCATTEAWMLKRNETTWKKKCALEGHCDNPLIRHFSPEGVLTVKIIIHIFQNEAGESPTGSNGKPITTTTIEQQMVTLNKDYGPLNIDFEISQVLWHKDNRFFCIPPYDDTDNWYNAILLAKEEYAVDPKKYLNVFVTCQQNGPYGTLLGIGTFPWDETALTNLGGLWMNSIAVGAGGRTFSHELGHNFGLWHTFRGVSETTGCDDPCSENWHLLTDRAADRVGDFCKDTPATPMNFACGPPGGTDCKKHSWENTAYTNIMGYGPDSCISTFTPEQNLRSHCWICSALRGYLTAPCSN